MKDDIHHQDTLMPREKRALAHIASLLHSAVIEEAPYVMNGLKVPGSVKGKIEGAERQAIWLLKKLGFIKNPEKTTRIFEQANIRHSYNWRKSISY